MSRRSLHLILGYHLLLDTFDFIASLAYDPVRGLVSVSVMEQSCSFNSLDESIAFLQKHFTGMIEISVNEVRHDKSELQRTRKVPRYVFRGEERDHSQYKQTVSTWRRLEKNASLDAPR